MNFLEIFKIVALAVSILGAIGSILSFVVLFCYVNREAIQERRLIRANKKIEKIKNKEIKRREKFDKKLNK